MCAYVLQWLVAKLGPKYIVSKTSKDGATPLHMAAGMSILSLLALSLSLSLSLSICSIHINFTVLDTCMYIIIQVQEVQTS